MLIAAGPSQLPDDEDARTAQPYDPRTALAGPAAADPGRCFVVGQLGQSRDGRIAAPVGAPRYINGRGALTHLHQLRARVDAVVIGVATAIADNPRLTTRLAPGPNPVRVVIDPRGRLPAGLALLADGAAPVLVVTAPGMRVPPGAEPVSVPAGPAGFIPPAEIVAALARRGLSRLLLEGGMVTLRHFLAAGLVDEFHLMAAPVVLGAGPTGFAGGLPAADGRAAQELPPMRFPEGDLLRIRRFALRPAPTADAPESR